ncbi:NADP-dependent 3-hydroxy acid dehydrogenase YdfG [Pseudokineococcus lusitanus]|uniref:NADP-dependent 3-hydroxy acid dehydrogenase YdfG n=1 Tax=Pseudokineococcus lusitanus TaxID=763993 RepID=A0A3N1GWB4_9ACTN|nr:NADP-dependent 3-hydroxy acid dehydrogenase YdfG [Pseudokineococcus lusitanus]
MLRVQTDETTSGYDGRVAWVTGAGSGMGRASALRLAGAGLAVAVSGRRRELLEQLVAEVTAAGGRAVAVPLDVQDADAVGPAHERVVAALGPVTDLVAAAGLNVPERYWRDQHLDEVTAVVDTNLLGVVRPVQAVLPGMRAAGGGTVTVISSYAGWQHSPHAGVAYSASKSALASVCRSLNDQEGEHGVRACHLCPGDVDTDFLAQRPSVPDAAARRRMLTADDVARAVAFVHTAPAHVRVDELVISPAGRG